MPTNIVVVVGNLTRDPESRKFDSGVVITTFSVAYNKEWKTGAGEKQKEVHYFDVTAFGKTASYLKENAKKGSKVLVNGELRQDRWKTKEGENRQKIIIAANSVEMLDKRGTPSEEPEEQETPF